MRLSSEVDARLAERVFSDSSFLDEIIADDDPAHAKAKRTLLTKLKELFVKLIAAFKGEKVPANIREMRAKLTKAFKSINAPTAARVSEGMASYKEYDFSKSFAEQLDDFDSGKFPKNDTLIMCGTTKVLQDIGLSALPMTYTQKHAREAIANEDGDHLGKDLLKQVPKALESPIAVIDSASNPGRLVAIIELNNHPRSVIAAVEIDGAGRLHGELIDSNVVVTVHSRNNAINGLLKNAIISESQGKGGVYYWQKNKAIALARIIGVQFPGVSTVADGFIRSIHDAQSKVNPRLNSIFESQQFKRWFGKSKIVNEDGTPKVVYHQTAADFDSFSTDKPVAGRYDSETPNGIFFKDNDHDIGIGGNKQMAVYLSMQNPLQFANREAANKWYQEHIDGYADLQTEMKSKLAPFDSELQRIENDMFADDVSDEQYAALEKEWDEKLEEMRAVEDDYRGRLRELLNQFFIKGDSGYDGIILDYDGHRYVDGKRENVKTYIVFKNTQVKSVENIGTFDGKSSNIYHSLKEHAPVAEGSSGEAFYGNKKGQSVKYHYALADVSAVVASHDVYGDENAEYPAELQPRTIPLGRQDGRDCAFIQ